MSQVVPVRTSLPEAERVERLYAQMNQSFGAAAVDIQIVRAPLRICPLGAHIDHQLGIVTGMTIDQSVLMAFAPTTGGRVRIQSSNFDSEIDFTLDDVPPFEAGDWGNYIRGAVIALQNEYKLSQGIVAYVDSEMPTGGLSSSAAVTVAYLMALESVNQIAISPRENIRLVSRTEQDYIGLKNGILDQTSILFSQPNSLTKIDCQDEDISQIASGSELADFDIMVVYSGVGKNLVGAGYNSRVAECQEAASLLLKSTNNSVAEPRLRLVEPALFESEGQNLPEIPRKRATHYFGEMDRVTQGIDAWRSGDLEQFGALMNQSGESSVHLYECGCPQLITLYELLRVTPGVIGTRFSGAGFRGNCIAFTKPNAQADIAAAIHAVYPSAHPDMAERYSVHFCHSAGPATLLNR